MDNGTTLPGVWAAGLAAVTTIVALFVTQGLIDNRTEKLVTGIAAVLIPLAYMIANAIHHRAHADVHAAQIASGIHSGHTSRR